MGIRHKGDIAERKNQAEAQLAARLETLKARGLGEDVIQREATVRKLKAAVRKAKQRLAAAAAAEKLTADKARIKAEKLAGPKPETPKKAPKAAGAEGEKKPKKAKKPAAAEA
jgi:hypothetical protein